MPDMNWVETWTFNKNILREINDLAVLIIQRVAGILLDNTKSIRYNL